MKASKLFPDNDYSYLGESLQVLYDIYTYGLFKHKISAYILVLHETLNTNIDLYLPDLKRLKHEK